MTDIVTRLQDAIHMESAAIAPRTSPLIEAAKEAIGEIERMKAAGATALEYLHGMQHLGSLVDQKALALDTAQMEAALGANGQSSDSR